MKKVIASVLACAMAAGMLAGCGSASSSAAGSVSASGATAASTTGEQTTIKVSTWDYTSNPRFENIVNAFEAAHPDIKVEVIDIPSADYTTKLSVMLNGGSEVDAFVIKDADTTKSLVDKGQLTDLTDLIESDGVDLTAYNGLAENFQFDGQYYALPLYTDYYIMYYNKDIFDAANVEYPSNDWTWDDFESIAAQLTSGEGNDKIYGATGWQHFWRITFPMLTPSHFFVFMMLTINSFKTFDLIFALTGGGPGTSTTLLSQYIYNKSFTSWDYGAASSASIILFVIVAAITVIQFRVEKKFNDFM